MTWQARDAIPEPKQSEKSGPPHQVRTVHVNPDAKDLNPPEPIPTYAQAMMYQHEDEEPGPIRWTLQEERAMMADGIWPEREWSAWRHAITRGIQSE